MDSKFVVNDDVMNDFLGNFKKYLKDKFAANISILYI